MIDVKFYEHVDDKLLKFAVIVSRFDGKWVFCKHKERNTYECPGGHRENGENIEDTAKRELWEETGAKLFALTPICVYSVRGNDGAITNKEETFGMRYYASITSFEPLPPLEIERIELFEELPTNWTYPEIQPMLLQKAAEVFSIN
ncbi:MAG: NUDIX domain-containing protein [Angelakisella sp.]